MIFERNLHKFIEKESKQIYFQIMKWNLSEELSSSFIDKKLIGVKAFVYSEQTEKKNKLSRSEINPYRNLDDKWIRFCICAYFLQSW